MWSLHDAGIANLPAALSIEWRAIEDDLHGLACLGAAHCVTVHDEGQDAALSGQIGVANKLGAGEVLLAPDLGLGVALEPRTLAADRALPLHGGLEAHQI